MSCQMPQGHPTHCGCVQPAPRIKPLHGDAEHWFGECAKLIAERAALAQRCRELDNLADQWAEKNGALLAEVERLKSQVATLQSDANSWQSGYDKGRRDGDRFARKEES